MCDIRDVSRQSVEHALSLLPPERQKKALGTRHQQARAACVMGYLLVRFAVRTLYPDAEPGDFLIEGAGKPAPLCGVHFSLSHTQGCVAVAVSDSHSVGVDVEIIAKRPDGFAARYFSPDQRHRLSLSPDPDAALTRLWCAKEAVTKERGTGLCGTIADIPTERAASDTFALGGNRYAIALSPADRMPPCEWVPIECLI